MAIVLALLVGIPVAILFGLTIGGWALMLAIGDLHHWCSAVPTIGFWTAVPIAILLKLAFGGSSASATTSK